MTKKNLERRYKFLLLQMKLIQKDMKDYRKKDKSEQDDIIETIKHLTKPETIMNKMKFIEQHDLNYNFYNEYMTVDSGEGGSL